MPGNAIAPFIGKSGKTMFFLLGDGTTADIWTSQASDPTYKVGSGSNVSLTDRTAYAITAGFGPPYVSYPLATKIEPSDVVTFSADAGWVSFGASGVAPAATNEPVTNWSGQEMFPITDTHTLKIGMNFAAPHPTQPVDTLRNMLKHTNGGGGLVSFDNNFIPTEIDGEVWYNTSNRVTGNGYNDRYTGGVVGTHWVTWDDYSVGRDKLAWIAVYDATQVLMTTVGPKLTIATTGSYTRYRQQFDVQFAPGRANDALAFNTRWNSVDVKNVEVVGPGEDPDSTDILSNYVKRVLAGVSNFRFMQCGPGIGSNIAVHAHCRQSADLSVQLIHFQQAQLLQVEPIIGTHPILWNGETFSVDKFTLMFPGTDPSFFVGLLCTTVGAHGFYTFQNVDLSQIYNNDYAKPTDATDHCGVQVNGLDGPIWMPFHQESEVTCFVVDETHFIVYPGFIVATAGVADPVGTQTFDISSGRSIVSTYFPRNGNISYGDAIQMSAENGSSPQLHISECMTDAGVTDVAIECRDKMIALGDAAPPFLYFALANEVWNPGWSAFGRITALSKIINQNVDRGIVTGATRQCHSYLAGRLLGIIKDVFTTAGMGNRVKRLIEFQRFGDVELQYAKDHGIVFEAGGPSSYYFSTFPAGSWDAYTDPGQIHDLWKWMLQYLVVGQQDAMLAIVADLMPGMEIVAYEGGEDQFTPGPTYDAALMTDWYYKSDNEHTTEMTFENAQRAGFDVLDLFMFSNGIRPDVGTLWQHSMNSAQEPGLGLDPPNWTVAELTGDENLDLHNQNPKLFAVGNWATNTPTPTPTILIPGIASVGTRTTTSIAMSATNATGGTPPYSYRWQISTDSGSTWNPATGTGVTTLSTTITGLTPGTSYQFRVQYTDSGA